MNEWIKDVADFHRVMELPTRERPTVPPADEVRMRLRINVEEMFEQLSACGEQPEEGDYGGSWQQHLESSKNEVMRLIDQMPVSICMAEFVDGLVDSIYVTIGAALAFGVDLEPVWKLVQAANMSKGSRCSDCLGAPRASGVLCRCVRYVGKTIQPMERRLQGHLCKARTGRERGPVGVWLRYLLAKGKRPLIVRLSTVDPSSRWQNVERYWIARLKLAGNRLLNRCPGGNGAHTRRQLPYWAQRMLGRYSDARIAELLGLSREAVTYHRTRLDIAASNDRSRQGGQFVKGQHAHNEIRTLSKRFDRLLGRLDDTTLALRAACSRGVIRRLRRQKQLPVVRRAHGAHHHNAKLTSNIVKAIRAQFVRYSRESGCAALARRYGVHITTVHAIVRGETWV